MLSFSPPPTLGLLQPSVGGPGPFSEGIPLLSGRGGQTFTGRGSLPFLLVSCQDEKVNALQYSIALDAVKPHLTEVKDNLSIERT